jgi:hypothetical protein
MKRIKETILRRQGRKRLLRRDYIAYGHKLEEQFCVEEPVPGGRGLVTRTYFTRLPEAERSLGTRAEADWWQLAPKGDRPAARPRWELRSRT